MAMPAINQAETSTNKPRHIRRGHGPQIAYDYIRSELLAARLPVGVRIEEAQIVNKLGLSRTPVRQALMRLATEGLLEIHPNQGARVPPLEFEALHSFFEAFEYLMRATSFLAAKYRTEDDLEDIQNKQRCFDAAVEIENVQQMIDANEAFHLAIARAGKNKELTRFLGDLLTKMLRLDSLWYRRQTQEDETRVFRRSSDEHAALVSAIGMSDPEGSMRASSTHVESFRSPFLRYLQNSDASEFAPPN